MIWALGSDGTSTPEAGLFLPIPAERGAAASFAWLLLVCAEIRPASSW